MNDTLTLALAWVAGGALGAIFYGGLWWTVCRGISSQCPALWFTSSLLLRMGIALVGLYFVSGSRWERLLLCLLGLVMARIVVTWLTRSPGKSPRRPVQEARHAP